MSGNGRLGEGEYAELVSRVQASVAEHVPPGSSVLVVSKGDASLVELPGVAAAHFPQASGGGYAGHHPHDSATATAQLEELRRHGAEYLVLPASSRWWLDFYGDFAAHLASHGELVADLPDSCLIYNLGRSVQPQAGPPFAGRPRATMHQVREYLESLVPEEATLVVLEVEAGLAQALSPLRATALRVADLAAADPLEGLRRSARGGAEYLVVPRVADEWLQAHADLVDGIEESCRKVADQRHLCRVYELSELGEEAHMGEEA
jgi:hypothetical protein